VTDAAHPAGASRPVVLVHGFTSSFEHNWRQPGWVEILGDIGRTVVGVDLLGHGSAPRPTDPGAYAEVPARVLGAVPDEGPVDAVGFSAGARVLLRLAVDHPERFARLVLLGLGDNAFTSEDHEPLAAALASGERGDDVGITLFQRLADTAGNGGAALAAFLRHGPPVVREDELGSVTARVLVVVGERDRSVPGTERLAAALPDVRVVVVPGVDHFATTTDFGAIDAVVRFLEDG
jgi:pimeloyl-ACP methyl ester carboxylesterase